MIVVVTIFACCWLPYHIYFLGMQFSFCFILQQQFWHLIPNFILFSFVALSRDQRMGTHARSVSNCLLARNVQCYVQSHHLLLDEFQVIGAKIFIYIFF